MCPLSEKLKTWNSAAPPRRHTGFLWPHADPGPNHSPRSPDSQFLEPFRLRPPKPPPGANGATPGRSRARRSRGEIPEFQFSVFWGRESETPRTRRVISEPSPSRYPRESISFPTSRDRSVSVRDRVGVGLSSDGTNLLYVLGFYNVSGNINSKIRVIHCFMFRDRLG
jgi:hypothetical protein